MNDTELLRGAVEAVREERRRRAHEERLDAYVEGRIDARAVAEPAALEGNDEDLEDELVAFAPIGEAGRQRIVARILDDVAGHAPPASTTRARGNIFSLRRVGGVVSALALAASLAFVLHQRGSPVPLPPYELASLGAEETWRGGPQDAIAPLHPLSRAEHLRLTARPSTAVPGAVAARVYLRRDAEVRAWPVSIDTSEAGAIRVVASPDTLPPGTVGDWELVLAIGRPDAPPGPADLDAASAARHGVRLVTTPLRFLP